MSKNSNNRCEMMTLKKLKFTDIPCLNALSESWLESMSRDGIANKTALCFLVMCSSISIIALLLSLFLFLSFGATSLFYVLFIAVAWIFGLTAVTSRSSKFSFVLPNDLVKLETTSSDEVVKSLMDLANKQGFLLYVQIDAANEKEKENARLKVKERWNIYQ